MPYTVKTTFSFAGQEQGWSEDFYWQHNTNNLSTAETLVTPLAEKRAALLASGYQLTVVRNAIVINEEGGQTKRLTDLFEPRLNGVQGWEPTTPNVTLLLVWQTGDNLYSKKQYMRGIPAGITDDGKKVDLTFGTFLSRFNAWREAMIQFGAGWLATTPTQTRTIDTYAEIENSGIIAFTFGGIGFTWPVENGKRTRIYVSLPGKNPMDGPLVVVPKSATTANTAEPIGVAPQIPGQIGSAQIRSPVFKSLAASGGQGAQGQIHPQRIGTHRTGRPSYASVGRRPARPKW